MAKYLNSEGVTYLWQKICDTFSGKDHTHTMQTLVGVAAASHTHNYLPLSGGTFNNSAILQGTDLTIQGAVDSPLYIQGGVDSPLYLGHADNTSYVHIREDMWGFDVTDGGSNNWQINVDGESLFSNVNTNSLQINHTSSTGEDVIIYKNNRIYSGSGEWADHVIKVHAKNDTSVFNFGVYGQNNTLEYAYLGTNSHNGDNLRIYSNKLAFGNNEIYHTGNLNKSVIENVLTGNITSHTHSYIPLTDKGLSNGKVPYYVNFPTPSQLVSLGYNEESTKINDEYYFKGLCKWAIKNYANNGYILLMGVANPNSSGFCCIQLYSNNGFDAATGLPNYCSGVYNSLNGTFVNFRCNEHIWYWKGSFGGNAETADKVKHTLAVNVNGNITSYDGSELKSATINPSTIGLGNVQNTAFYQRPTFVNGTQWNMAGTSTGNTFTIFAPTIVGTSGHILQSSGSGAPIWANPANLTVGSATNASKLSSHSISELTYASIYTRSKNDGILVQTDFDATSNSQVCAHIWGNGYNADMPINTYIQFYNYTDGNSIIDRACNHYGLNLGDVYAFNYKGKVCFWFDVSKWMYQTICVFVGTSGNAANTSAMVFNHVASLDNVAKPTGGVTREVTITPRVNAFLDSNVTSADHSTSADSAREAGMVENALTIKMGESSVSYNGSAVVGVEITPSKIGAATASHTHSYLPLSGGTMSNTNLVTNLNADLLDGYHATYANNKPWGTIPVITAGGYMDVGKHFEFHYDNTTGSDYSTILMCTGNYSNIVNLPSKSGTLALLTDNVASASKLGTSTVGSDSLPIYLNNGTATVCNGSSLFSNLSNSGNSLSMTIAGVNKTLQVGYAASSGRANSAAEADGLTTTRYFSCGGAVTSGSAPFNGTQDVAININSVKEAYLSWGGTNISGSISPLDAALSSFHSANRLAFANPGGVIVEYSRDGGVTWHEYQISDKDKTNLISGMGSAVYVGGTNATAATTKDQLRITLVAQKRTSDGKSDTNNRLGIYTRPRKLLLNVSTSGATGCKCKVERAKGGSPTTFIEQDTYDISGWTHWNSIPIDSAMSTFGGSVNQTDNWWVLRLTFSIGGVHTNSAYNSRLSVQDIQLFGDTYWSTQSSLATSGHMYTWDYNKNVEFPAKITSSGFIKSGSSSSYVLLGNGDHKAESSLSVASATWLYGKYTGNGGKQNPNYFGTLRVGALMMNTVVNGNSQYKDWIISDCYTGSDVGGAVAFGVNRQKLGAYIMRSASERTEWTESAELLGTHNFNSYAPKLDGTGATGTWGINISGNAASATNAHETVMLKTTCNITIGNATKAFNGSQSSLSWSLADIGAAAASHNHDTTYLKLSGGTMSNAQLVTNLNADLLDGYNASNLVKFYLSPMDSGATADSAKSWFVDVMPAGTGAIVYNVPGLEKTIIAGKSTGPYGHMLQLNYNDNYLRILRYYNGSWETTDWEKISAGYADTTGKWSTPRTITLTGSVTGSVSIDGSQNVSLATTTNHTHSEYLPKAGGTLTGALTVPTLTSTGGIVLGVASINGSLGIKKYNNTGFIGFSDISGGVNGSVPFDGISLGWGTNPETSANSVRINESTFTYKGNVVLRTDNFNSYAPKLDGTGATGTWGINISGNAVRATTAAEADMLKTACSIKVGNTAKSFNGTQSSLSWSLADIGAAAALHTHDFADITNTPTVLKNIGVQQGSLSVIGSDNNIYITKTTGNLSGVGVSGTDNIPIPGATTSYNGVMSSKDKTKLDTFTYLTTEERICNYLEFNYSELPGTTDLITDIAGMSDGIIYFMHSDCENNLSWYDSYVDEGDSSYPGFIHVRDGLVVYIFMKAYIDENRVVYFNPTHTLYLNVFYGRSSENYIVFNRRALINI